MSTVFVTGANGFIGTHLVEALRARGDDVRQMVWRAGKRLALPEIEASDGGLIVASTQDVEAMAKGMQGADYVFHVAGRTAAYRREEFEESNAQGVRNLFRAIESLETPPRRVLIVSSAMAAGPSPRDRPLSEAHATRSGETMYGDSKLSGEKIAFEVAQRTGQEIVIVRPPLVYGPGERDVLQLLRAARFGLIAQPGFSPSPISAIYVSDLVDGMLAAMERGRCLPREAAMHVLQGGGEAPDRPAAGGVSDERGVGIYYLTDGGRYTASGVARHGAVAMGRSALTLRFPAPAVRALGWAMELVGRMLGRLPSLTRDKARGSLLPWLNDDSRAQAEFGFRPKVSIDEGMRRTVEWYREHEEL